MVVVHVLAVAFMWRACGWRPAFILEPSPGLHSALVRARACPPSVPSAPAVVQAVLTFCVEHNVFVTQPVDVRVLPACVFCLSGGRTGTRHQSVPAMPSTGRHWSLRGTSVRWVSGPSWINSWLGGCVPHCWMTTT